jgi:hypothetical protein
MQCEGTIDATVTNMLISDCNGIQLSHKSVQICLYARVVDSSVAFVGIGRARIAELCRIFLHLGCANMLSMCRYHSPIKKYDMNQKRNSSR